jgi:pimeloyl-ACP methyl ester carboxylesterase
VILLHGWPYDIHSYLDVAPLLAAQGYRVIIPYLRGYGTTRFLAKDTFVPERPTVRRCRRRRRADGRPRDRTGGPCRL